MLYQNLFDIYEAQTLLELGVPLTLVITLNYDDFSNY